MVERQKPELKVRRGILILTNGGLIRKIKKEHILPKEVVMV